MSKLKYLIKLLTPPFIQHKVRRLREENKLNKIKKLNCKVDTLRSINNFDLKEVVNSSKTHDLWTNSSSQLEYFKIPDGSGGVNPGDRKFLYYLITYLRPNSILEIGTHIGASTSYITAALATNETNIHSIKLTTVDISDVNSETAKPWVKYGSKYKPVDMINKINPKFQVDFVVDKSIDFLHKTQQKFDFIFLDGDHSAATVYQEIPVALKRLNKDGIILLHDYFPKMKPLWNEKYIIEGPYLAVQRFIKEGTNLEVLPVGKLPWATKLSSNITSLALLLKKSN